MRRKTLKQKQSVLEDQIEGAGQKAAAKVKKQKQPPVPQTAKHG